MGCELEMKFRIFILALTMNLIKGDTITFDDATDLPVITRPDDATFPSVNTNPDTDTSSYYEIVTVSSPSIQKPLRKSSRNKGKGKRKSAKAVDDGYFVVMGPSSTREDDVFYASSKKKKYKSSKNMEDDHFIVVASPSSTNDDNYYLIINQMKKKKTKSRKSANRKNDDGFIVIPGPSSIYYSQKNKSNKSQKRNDDGVVVVVSPSDILEKRKSGKIVTVVNDDRIQVVGGIGKRKSIKNSKYKSNDGYYIVKSDDAVVVRPAPEPALTDDVLVLKSPISGLSGAVKDYDIGNTYTLSKTKK
jgi:hypothetical protein